jgi:hypothetical protein
MMPEEMVTRTTDSPAVDSGDTGLSNSVTDFIRDNAGPDDNSQWATSELAGQDAEYGGDDSSEVDYTDVVDDILGLKYENQNQYQAEPTSPQPVPYERFREVNERARTADELETKLNRWGRVIEQFEQQGYQSSDDIDRVMEQQQQSAYEDQVRNRYQQLADSQIIDPAVAQMQQEAEIAKYRYEQQMSQVQGYMLMQQRDIAVQQYPLAQRAPGLVDNLIQAGFNPMEAAQAVHEQVRTIAQSLAPEIASRMNKTKRSPQPMGNGQAARMAPTGGGGGQQRTTLGSLLGITRGRGTL